MIVLTACPPVFLLSFVLGGPAGEWTFALLGSLFPVALIALAVGRRRRVLGMLLALAALLAGSTAGVLLLTAADSEARSLSGLPPATALMLLGLGLGPLILVGVGHAATFEDPGSSRSGRDESGSGGRG